MRTMINKKTKLLIFFSLIYFFFTSIHSETLKIGSKDAKITVKVFSSLTCPHCASFHKKIFKDLKKDYIDKGIVKFEHHAFPLDLAALNAEKIVRCASNSNEKFKLLGKIYEKQKKWAVGSDINKINESLMNVGIKYKLSKENMLKCLEDENLQDIILNERISAQKKYKISSTPTIYINKKKYNGSHKYKDFKKEIEKKL